MNRLRISRVLALLAAGMVAFQLAACSSFPREFRAAEDDYREAVAAGDLPTSPAGPWEGEWVSGPSGHRGPLWCLVEPEAAVAVGAPGVYRFRYRAGWGKLLRGNFTQAVPVERAPDGGHRFRSSMDLGKLGGVYSVESELGPQVWSADYSSTKGDRGTMILRRPGADGVPGEAP